MFDKIISFLSRFANGKSIIIFLVTFIFINAVVLSWAGAQIAAYSGGVGPIDLQFSYTPDTVYSMVAAYGEEGRSFYRMIDLTVDVVYPIVTLLLFAGLIIFTYSRAFPDRPALKNLALVSVVGTLFDFLENAGVVTMLSIYPNRIDIIAQLSSLFTTAKWIFAVGGMGIAAVGLVAWLIKRFTSRTDA
jgi:hypothetical protein